MIVKRKRGPDWKFEFINGHWYYKTEKNLYRIFIEDDECGCGMWIGRLIPTTSTQRGGWFTCASLIGAVSIDFIHGTYFFK